VPVGDWLRYLFYRNRLDRDDDAADAAALDSGHQGWAGAQSMTTNFAVGLFAPNGLAFDSAGNLFAADFNSDTVS
jgi:hypothetical protein